MSFRGGRRGGRWGRGGGRSFVAPKPFVLFPETELPDIKAVKEEKSLVSMSLKWENFWKSSAYYLEEKKIIDGQMNSPEIERFSDKNKKRTTSKRDSMYQILQLTPSNFPRVLITGSKESRSRKRVRWNPLKDLERFEALENKDGGEDDSEKEDDEDDEDKPEEEEEFSDDGDYNQNVDFDDDEDDFNMDDGGDDEPEF